MKSPVRQSVLHGTALIFSGRMLNRFFGLGREILSAALFGSSRAMDCFNLAFTIVTSLRGAFAEQFLTPIIPTYFRRRSEQGESAALRSLNLITTQLNLFALLLSAALLLAARQIISWIAPGFDAEQAHLATILIRWFAIGGIAFTLYPPYSGLHMCFFRYTTISFSPILMNIGALTAMYFFAARYGVISLAAGFSLGFLAFFLVLAFFLPHRRELLRPKLGNSDPGVSAYWKMLLPLFLAMAFEQVQLYVDRALATGLPVGTLSAQGYALRIIRMSSELWLASFGTVIFPVFASLAASDKPEEFSRNFSLALQAAMLFLAFSGATIIAQAEPFVRVLLERGAFHAGDTALTAQLLNYYTVAYMAQAIWIIILRGFHAFGNTKTPVYLTTFSMLVTIALDFILIKPLGINGLALALAVGYSLNMILSYIFFSRHVLAGHTRENLKTAGIGLILAAILGYLVHRCWTIWEMRQMMQGLIPGLLGLAALTTVAGLLFFGILRWMKVPALQYVLEKLKLWRERNKANAKPPLSQ